MPDDTSPLPPHIDETFRRLWDKLVADHELPRSGRVFVATDLPPGTTLRAGAVGRRALMRVPEGPRRPWLLVVDPTPALKFVHPVTWLLVDPLRGTSRRVKADRLPELTTRRGAALAPRSATEHLVDGLTVILLGPLREIVAPADARRPDPEPPPDPPPVATRVRGTDPCLKLAYVADLGDWGQVIEDNMAADADSIQSWLAPDFTVTRVSQYSGNSHRGYKGAGRARQIAADIAALGVQLSAANSAGCCHELFLYFGAHGDARGLSVYEFDGSQSEDLYFRTILNALGSCPPNTRVIIFVDACESGGLIDVWKADYAPAWDSYFSKCGVTLLTVTDAFSVAAGGQWPADSGTEDFMEGATKDHDNDGSPGDIRDRFEEMKRQGAGYNPQSYHSGPGGPSSWGSLD